MNKQDLVDILTKNVELNKKAAHAAVDTVFDAITQAIALGDSVTLVGFGTFKQSTRAARTGRNPQTGAELEIPAAKVPKFTPGASLKAAVAGKRATGASKAKPTTKARAKKT